MRILTSLHLVVGALLLASCSKPHFKTTKIPTERALASQELPSEIDPLYLEELRAEAKLKSHRLEFPPGLNDEEKAMLWHAAEGSEIYPLLWMINLRSGQSSLPKSMFLERLDEKFGMIKDYLPEASGYPLKWVGLTAAWSDEHPVTQDIILKPGSKISDLPKVMKLKNGKTSIAMAGVNCTFCHTGRVSFEEDGKKYDKIIEGAPSMVDARGFIRDMVGSTIQMMGNKKLLTEFFKNLDVPNAEEEAAKFSKEFKAALGVSRSLKTEMVKFFEVLPFLGQKVTEKKNSEVPHILFKHRDEIYAHLIKLLKITYGFENVPEVLILRMKYLAALGSPSPALEETPSGYGRTDAFGRISNSVARGNNPIALTAPVSIPYMYAIKYKSMFHYNANTNSVIARNIGQSFGLGAILSSPEKENAHYASTSNLHNLIKMEKVMYKLKVPEMQEYFPNMKVDKATAVKGCNIYMNKCMGCHEANDKRVGPESVLIDYKVLPLKKIGTDETYIWNQATPINGQPFRKGIFDFTDNIKNWYFSEYNVSPEEIAHWANQDIRGSEVFRDTVNGDVRFKNVNGMEYIEIEKGRGFVAKSLAGIWATAPYLHNGSVSSIYEMLLPSVKRQKYFVVGTSEYDHKKLGYMSSIDYHPLKKDYVNPNLKRICEDDPTQCFDVSLKGNSNVGHEPSMYGGELREEEKYQLIEFLKIVRPENEYAWTSTPIYKMVGNKCEIRE